MMTPAVELRAISKSYRHGGGAVEALIDVSLSIARGEFVLLVGPSGSGKTTLLNLISALDRPDNGKIWVGDRVYEDYMQGTTFGMIFPAA